MRKEGLWMLFLVSLLLFSIQEADGITGGITADFVLAYTPGWQPRFIAIDPITTCLFVADADNRVLRFPSLATLPSNPNPEVVFGQKNFVQSSANQGMATPSAKTLYLPSGIFVDMNGTLWVADSQNNR